MVIYLHRSLSDIFTDDSPRSDYNRFLFSDIISADYHSKHSVFIDPQLTNHALPYFLDSLKGWILHIDSQTTNLASLVAYVDHVLVLASGDLQNIYLPDCLDNKSIVVDWAIFENSMLSKSILLGENLEDCRFYTIIAEYYLYLNKIKGYNCACESNSGGGSTTHEIYRNHVLSQHRLCLCIADSDKHFNEDKIGGTLQSLMSAQADIDSEKNIRFLGKLLPLPVLEAENLIPLSVLQCCFSKEKDCQKGLEIIQKFVNTFSVDEQNPALFYDLKKGLRAKNCAKSVNSKGVQYWRKIFSAMGDEIVTEYDEKPLPKEKRDDIVRAGISNNNLLRKVVTCIESPALLPNISDISVDGYWAEMWTSIGRAIFTWSCASPHHSG